MREKMPENESKIKEILDTHYKSHLKNNPNIANYEYSSESLLLFVREGNLRVVKDILEHSSLSTAKETSHQRQQFDNYLTVTSRTAKMFFDKESRASNNIEIECTDDVKQTPLILASRYDYLDIVGLLLNYGASVNKSDVDQWTPLLNACKNGNLKIVELLLEHKANIEDRDCGGFTPLMWACYKNHLDIVRLLLNQGANPNVQCKNGISCLSWAAGRGFVAVAEELLNVPNIKVDTQDRNGFTPLLWAARKGSLPIVKMMIDKNADANTIGMNNITPLIVSCKNGHEEVSLFLLQIDEVNVNHTDKDGNTALFLAVKTGKAQVVLNLIEKGAYINTTNKKGENILITAVKAGHKEIVEALLDKHVEIDAIGNLGKTPIHYAIEKGNFEIMQSLLSRKPDLEIANKDGDTPLLLATKKKSSNIVSELLDHGSKISPVDKNGDNALHISLRNRSHEITELILSNPKNSKYLYKPNKKGVTPYKIDSSNPKSILTQIFGARHLNMAEDSFMGYDLYSGALAEILSEPSLHTPITVGLYAKWGSGKSFLLAQLKSEMKSFAKLTQTIRLQFNVFLVATLLFFNLLFAIPFCFWIWSYGLVLFSILSSLTVFAVSFCKFFYEKREKAWARRACDKISAQIEQFKLVLQILFLNPLNYKNENLEHKSLRFIFVEYGKISSIGSGNALALMIDSLHTKMESQFGLVITRLCRVFYERIHSHSRFRRFCCFPTFVLVTVFVLMLLALALVIRIKGSFSIQSFNSEEQIFTVTLLFIICLSILISSPTWLKIILMLIRPGSAKLMKAVHTRERRNSNQESKLEGFIFKLKQEVDLIAYTLRTIDTFTHGCTRLVIIIDGLDSCEQRKVLQILEIIHVLFTKEGDPFISILAVDPHFLIRGGEGAANFTDIFKNGTVNGHDYLRTVIHLPVYLQNNLPKDKTKLCQHKKFINPVLSMSQELKPKMDEASKEMGNKKNKKNRGREKTNNGKAKAMTTHHLTDQMIRNEYFIDVNPRNLRRLINEIALTARLLRAYHITFDWRLLASWVYLNEQWPYRCSWLIMYINDNEQSLNDEWTLQQIYEKIKHKIPVSNEPLLELDRNANKFERFLNNSKLNLTLHVIKQLLPYTVNIDPYFIKLIRDSHEMANTSEAYYSNNHQVPGYHSSSDVHLPYSFLNSHSEFKQMNIPHMINESRIYAHNPSQVSNPNVHPFSSTFNNFQGELVQRRKPNNLSSIQTSNNFSTIDLSKSLLDMTVDDVCTALVNDIYGINETFMDVYKSILKEKNINGQVLSICDLEELKDELRMTFGDWQLFRNWVISKRGIGGSARLGLIQSPTVSPINNANAAAYELAGFVNNSFRYDPNNAPTNLLTINTNNLQANGNKMRKVDFYLHSNKQSDDLAHGSLNTSNVSKMSQSLARDDEKKPLIVNEPSPNSKLADTTTTTTTGMVESLTRTTLILDESEMVNKIDETVDNSECSPLLNETRKSSQLTSSNQQEQQLDRDEENKRDQEASDDDHDDDDEDYEQEDADYDSKEEDDTQDIVEAEFKSQKKPKESKAKIFKTRMQNLSIKKLLSPKSLSPSSSTKSSIKNKTEFLSMKKVDAKSEMSSSTSHLNTINNPSTPEEPTSSKSNKPEQSSTVYILDEEEDIF